MSIPKVSIVTALHNKGRYVAETVRATLAQTMPEWEMIVVENGSEDDGPELVRQFVDPRIHLVFSPKKGPGAARNYGLGLARGEWILFLDADDLLEPDYLRERLSLLETHDEAELLAGNWVEFPDGVPENKRLCRSSGRGGAFDDLADVAIACAPWALHAALVKRSRLLPERHWPESLDGLPHEDAAFWFPVVSGASVAWSDCAGAAYRIATINSRNEISDASRTVEAAIAVIEHNLNYARAFKCGPNGKQIAAVVRVLESNYRMAIRKGNRAAASRALQQAECFLMQAESPNNSMRVRRLLGLRVFNLFRFGVI